MERDNPRNFDFFGTYLTTLSEIRHTPTKEVLDTASVWSDVGNCLLDAMLEKADELGGEPLREQIADMAQADAWLIPNAQALITLENHTPGTAEQTIKLAEAMLLGKMSAEQIVTTKAIGKR